MHFKNIRLEIYGNDYNFDNIKDLLKNLYKINIINFFISFCFARILMFNLWEECNNNERKRRTKINKNKRNRWRIF